MSSRTKIFLFVVLPLALVLAIVLFLNGPAAYEGRGWASMDMGEFEKALGHFDKAIEKWPENRFDHCPPYCGKVIALTFLERWEETIPVCDRIIAMECEDLFAWPYRVDAWPHVRRGIAHLKLGDFDAALADFDAALGVPTATDLERYEALVGRGNVLCETGDYKQAIEELTSAVALEFPFETVIHELDYSFYCYYFEKDAYLLMGKAYEGLGMTDEAMVQYRMAGEAGVH